MAKPKVLVFLGTSRQGAAVVDALRAALPSVRVRIVSTAVARPWARRRAGGTFFEATASRFLDARRAEIER